MPDDIVVKVRNLTQQFGKSIVLKDMNLDIYKGEILGLLGPSGSGKTTLVKNIIGMNAPSEGNIVVLDTKIPSLNVVKRIGYMAQSDALYEDLNAMDNLMFFASLYGLKSKVAKKRALEVLALVQLKRDAKKLVHTFSGGMKRRLSLAIALIHSPEILILDEPTVGIDPLLRREFWDEFDRLKTNGTTILVTTHVMDEAERCDRLALIRDGGIIALDSPEELKKSSGESSIEGAFLFFASSAEEVSL